MIELIKSYNDIPQKIKKLNTELRDLTFAILVNREGVQACTISDMPKGNHISDPTYRSVEKFLDNLEETGLILEEQSAKVLVEIKKLIKQRQDVKEALDALQYEEAYIIAYRYIDNMSWGDISKKMNLSRMQVHRISLRAKNKLKNF